MEKILTELGLGNKEQKIYNLVLQRGKITPALLSRLSGINRTTVYSVAKELVTKGLIIEDLGNKTLYYTSTRAEGIEKLIQREIAVAKTRQELLGQLQESLKLVPESNHFSVPKIRFIDGADIEQYLYEATPRWIESLLQNDTVWWGFQDHSFAEKYEDWIDWYWKKAPAELTLKLFTNDSDIEKTLQQKKYDRREIRLWSDNNFTSSQWIVGAYVIMIVTNEKPYYMVEIHDSVMAHNMREVFKRLWEKN